MGEPKQLLEVKGKIMIDHAIKAALGASDGAYADRPVLVLGACYKKILQKSKLADRCEIVINHNYTSGQARSLIAGVKQIQGKCDGAVFMLCDQPFVDAKLVRALTEKFNTVKPGLLYPVYNEQRGNPVIISSKLFSRLLNARGDQGARFLFKDSSLDIYACKVDAPGILVDVDTPQDYERLK